LELGKTYVLRLLPYVKEPSKTIYAFRYCGWNSNSTGNYIEFVDPATFDSPSPLSKISRDEWMKYRSLPDEDVKKKNSKKLWAKSAWLINCYVISDETDPENNGKVKVLRVGKQLYEIITDAFSGSESEEFGARIFDISANGCNLKIRVTENEGGYNNYTKSRFQSPSEIDGISNNPNKISEIYEQCHDLTTVYPIRTYDDVKKIIDEHYFTSATKSDDTTSVTKVDGLFSENPPTVKSKQKNDDDDVPFSKSKDAETKSAPKAKDDDDEDFLKDEDDIDIDAILSKMK
jgi:hypothetical protein